MMMWLRTQIKKQDFRYAEICKLLKEQNAKASLWGLDQKHPYVNPRTKILATTNKLTIAMEHCTIYYIERQFAFLIFGTGMVLLTCTMPKEEFLVRRVLFCHPAQP
jgi:hypothetical protein